MTAGIIISSGSIIVSLILTILLEGIIYFIWFRKDYLKTLHYCLLINLFTVPLANILYGLTLIHSETFWIFFIEFVVILVESVLIAIMFRNKWWKGLILSIVANVISAVLGLILIVSFFQFY